MDTPQTLQNLLEHPISTSGDAEDYLYRLNELGYSYHPEDSATTAVRVTNGEPLFTRAQAVLADVRMGEVHDVMHDPCAYLLDLNTHAFER